ncbi:MAG: hypothetical protein QME96_07000 [Myxococcota bacterium]|nr:hypothetical protein [Myxococcota bacterium]
MAVDKLMGEVRAAFPADRARQDTVFPTVLSAASSDDAAEEATPGGGGAGGGSTS